MTYRKICFADYGAIMAHLAQLFHKNFLPHNFLFALIYPTFARHFGRLSDIFNFVVCVFVRTCSFENPYCNEFVQI